MKRLIYTLIAFLLFFANVKAQEDPGQVKTEVKTKKIKKGLCRQKKEALLLQAAQKAGLSEREQQLVLKYDEDINDFRRATLVNAQLTEVEMQAKIKTFMNSTNKNLKDSIGETKYKVFRKAMQQKK